MEIVVSIPYSTKLSKNQSHINISVDRRVPTKDYLSCLDLLGILLKQKLGDRQFKKQKIWVSLFVYRKDMRADPVNFVDGVVDGVKKAIGIDDRWYAGSWDWGIDKKNPRIIVRVSQDD